MELSPRKSGCDPAPSHGRGLQAGAKVRTDAGSAPSPSAKERAPSQVADSIGKALDWGWRS